MFVFLNRSYVNDITLLSITPTQLFFRQKKRICNKFKWSNDIRSIIEGFMNENKYIHLLENPMIIYHLPKLHSLPAVYVDHFDEPV